MLYYFYKVRLQMRGDLKMIVMNHDGDLFDERRKKERRKNNENVDNDRRKEDRRKVNINEVKKKK